VSDTSAPKRDKFSGLSRRQKRRKIAAEADKEFNDKHAVESAIRAAKHAQRPRKIGDDAPRPSFGKKKGKDAGRRSKPGHTSAKTKILGKDSKFKAEMGVKRHGGGGGRATEGMRAKKGDGGVLGGKKGGKGGKGKVKGRR
jgi:ATP-dependent RNA helicase DDX27